jgi:hypothetical protein
MPTVISRRTDGVGVDRGGDAGHEHLHSDGGPEALHHLHLAQRIGVMAGAVLDPTQSVIDPLLRGPQNFPTLFYEFVLTCVFIIEKYENVLKFRGR